MSTDDVTEVSKKLDGLVIDVFDTLHQLLAAKSNLEAAMKDGYLFMAKVRRFHVEQHDRHLVIYPI